MFRKLPKFDVMLSSAGCLFVVVVVLQSFKFLRIYSEESGFQILLMQANKKPLRFSAEFPISFHYHWAYYSPRSNHFFRT